MRKSPCSFAAASRVIEDPAACTKTRALGTRAALASWTSPRSAPFGFWARRRQGRETNTSTKTALITARESKIDLLTLAGEILKSLWNPPARHNDVHDGCTGMLPVEVCANRTTATRKGENPGMRAANAFISVSWLHGRYMVHIYPWQNK